MACGHVCESALIVDYVRRAGPLWAAPPSPRQVLLIYIRKLAERGLENKEASKHIPPVPLLGVLALTLLSDQL